jgi:chromosome partitioning protein
MGGVSGSSRMSSVAFISTKGGAGKSTVAAQFAIAASGKGRKPLILDCDAAQTSIQVWASALRHERLPVIRTGSQEAIAGQLAKARGEGFDLVVIDVPPGGGQLVTLVASLAEHILVPVRATTFDLHAMRNTVDLLRAAADNTEPAEVTCRNALGKAAIVLNGTPVRPSASWRKDMMGALAQCGAGGLDVVGSLADRAAYSASIENGRGVTEEKRDPKAVEEIMELYRNVAGLERRRAAAIRKAGGRK